MKIFMTEVPIFGVQVVTCTGCTAEEAQNQFYDLQGMRSVVKVPDGRGACLIPGDEIYVWVKDPDNNASTVFHELVHVALGVCDLRGMQRDDELVAYLVGWLKQNVADKVFETDEGGFW